jgi:probable H4MPT-linked C1 transfer pathway protein
MTVMEGGMVGNQGHEGPGDSHPGGGQRVIGWDIGGAHIKACLWQDGQVQDVAQWACQLWLGLDQLDAALQQAAQRWPLDRAMHAATMTGEMADNFANREQGVLALAAHLTEVLGAELQLYAGAQGWVPVRHAARHWAQVASANWRLTAELLARLRPDAVLVDIGSTTTDLVPVRGGQVAARGANDHQRMASHELLYLGVVRTPLCALGDELPFRGERVNTGNEFYATTADVYRTTGELDPTHDLHPSADNAPKTEAATFQRMARMVGCDARDAEPADWQALARHWREVQLQRTERQLRLLLQQVPLPESAPLVGAGCGSFLLPELAQRLQRPSVNLGELLWPANGPPPASPALRDWAQVCAPSVAAAWLGAQRLWPRA